MIVLDKIDIDDLIVQLKARKKYAFSVLYDNYAPALLGIATKIVRDQQVGEDVLQEVFVKIWRNINTYDTARGTLFTWMFNITRNASKDYLRSKKYQDQLRIAGNGLESVDSFYPSGPSNYQDEYFEILGIIQKLDAKYRELIDLVYIYGYTQIEVAQMLNIPLGTVKTRCRAACQQLRRYFEI